MTTRKIGLITGTRAEWGIIKAILTPATGSTMLKAQLYVTGMHLIPEFGNTVAEIRKEYKNDIIELPMYDPDAKERDASYYGKSFARAITNFIDSFTTNSPCMILVVGDRIEVMAACLAAALMKIPIAHVHGGDSADSGQIDEQIRHAITKISHLHFAATELSAQRIRQMGEEDWRVFVTGSPSLDFITNLELFSKKELIRELNLENKVSTQDDIILCVQHPNILNANDSGKYMAELMLCLKNLGLHVVIIYPNNDPGSELIIAEIKKNESNPKFHVYRNLDRKVYFSLIHHAIFMIGNSSSGIIESAIFHLPVVNVGIRNINRESSDNVVNVENGIDNINKGIQKVMAPSFRQFCKSVRNKYGDGGAGKRIVTILETIHIDDRLLKKQFILRP